MNTSPEVTTWANSFGVWHARVRADCMSPQILASAAIREELTRRENPTRLDPNVWMRAVHVPELDMPADPNTGQPATTVYREWTGDQD